MSLAQERRRGGVVAKPTEISQHMPPFFVRDLVAAAARGDTEAIDEITDRLASAFPKLVRPRRDVAQGYESRAALSQMRIAQLRIPVFVQTNKR